MQNVQVYSQHNLWGQIVKIRAQLARGLIFKLCTYKSHPHMQTSLHTYPLKRYGILACFRYENENERKKSRFYFCNMQAKIFT